VCIEGFERDQKMPKTAKATDQKSKKSEQSQDTSSEKDSKKQVRSVEYSEAVESGALDNKGQAGTGQFDILLDMGVLVTVGLGQTEIPVRRLLQLGPGSVLTLNKSVDSPVDLYLKDAKFAEGDVVVVDGCFGVRIKKIIGVEVEAAETKSDS
jgi:flagellar motor switch protein FliN/FliY